MDTQKTKKVGLSKALIALTAAVSCLVIYILACVLSPVTWSPDSSKIALLVTPMDDDPDVYSIFTYDIATGERLLLDEVKEDGALSAPAWSPDGKWIAYYKVDPSPPEEPAPPPQTDPNAKEQTSEKTTAEELFSEENKMLPSFLLEIAKEKLEEEEPETFDVKLMAVTPDGKEKKVLRVLKFAGDEDTRKGLSAIKPEWSADSKSLFYVRVANGGHYIASLDIDTGQMYIHLFSSTPMPILSPDGKWVASLLEDTLILGRVDGTMCKYLKIDELEYSFAIWSPDSKKLLLTAKNVFVLIDTNTGDKKLLHDPGAELLGFGCFSPPGDSIYYLAGYESDDPNSPEPGFGIKSMNLNDKKTTVLFTIPEQIRVILDGDALAQFSVSPNGRMFLVRAVKEDDSGEGKSILLFWDGKTKKIVETDPWLVKILFTDKDLIFEEKLIGKWKGKDGATLISERAQENTYKLTLIEQNDEKQIYTASLYKQKNMMFLYVRSEQKDESIYVKVDRTEPKLLLREEMDYDEVAEMLSKPPESLKQETTEIDYAFEGTRVQ